MSSYERKESTTYGDIYSVHFINIFMSEAALGIRNRKSSETHSVLKSLP